MINHQKLADMHNQNINVVNFPYSHCFIKEFLPYEYALLISSNFKFQEEAQTPDVLFQKTKRGLSDYNKFPQKIKTLVDYLNSKVFLEILEKKFNLKNLIPNYTFFGGGMHESRNGAI